VRTVVATRYVMPLREGGSLPGLVEADDDGMYVCKFRGAGQGPKALVAEVVCGELARTLGFATPETAPAAELSADVVWFDALITNVDRTPRNPNLLEWHRRMWLIDHGAALYQQHAQTMDPALRFAAIREHVLLPYAASIAAADARLAPRLADGAVDAAVAEVPEEWLDHAHDSAGYLRARLGEPRGWAEEAEHARLP
jgi:hypothetical protein